ncbi:large ribosomal subunit protein uL4m [Aegotheles albertisi]
MPEPPPPPPVPARSSRRFPFPFPARPGPAAPGPAGRSQRRGGRAGGEGTPAAAPGSSTGTGSGTGILNRDPTPGPHPGIRGGRAPRDAIAVRRGRHDPRGARGPGPGRGLGLGPGRDRGEEPPPAPILRPCSLPVPSHRVPVQAWVGSLRHHRDLHRGLADLHPDVFAVRPRLDILHTVAMWQKNYKRISYAKVKSRAEVRGGGRKPWRQKGSGRARHGSIRSPLWRGGGISHGPRGPTSYFYMVPMKVRVLGLKVALTVKLMQDDLHIVDNLEMPSADPQYLLDLARFRHWGRSVLIVDVNEAPENIGAAAAGLKTINVIPALALSVHGLLKHQTLVLTVATVTFLEQTLLWHDGRYAPLYPFAMPYRDLTPPGLGPPPGCQRPPPGLGGTPRAG